MSPLTVGAAVAAVMAGPPLYSLVQSGQLDGTTALARGLLVAAVCAVAASYIQGIMLKYELESERKHQLLLRALAEAEQQKAAQAAAKQAEARRAKDSFS